MKFRCCKPVKLKPYITIFINLQGYKVEIERADVGPDSGAGPSLPPPPPPPPQDRAEDKSEDDSSDGGDDEYHRKRRKMNSSAEDTAVKGGDGQQAPTDLVEQPVALAPLSEVGVVTAPIQPEQTIEDCTQTAIPELPKSMFSQYGSNFTPEGNVFKTLGEVVQAMALPGKTVAQSATISEAPPLSNLSDSFQTSPRVVGEVEETDSARAREWRSKRNQDRASKQFGEEKARELVAESKGVGPDPDPSNVMGD